MSAVLIRAHYRRDPEEKAVIFEHGETAEVPDALILGKAMQAAQYLPGADRAAIAAALHEGIQAGRYRLE